LKREEMKNGKKKRSERKRKEIIRVPVFFHSLSSFHIFATAFCTFAAVVLAAATHSFFWYLFMLHLTSPLFLFIFGLKKAPLSLHFCY
jgi:hypothetical protein